MRIQVTKLTSVRGDRGQLIVLRPGDRVPDRLSADGESVMDEVANLQQVLGEARYASLLADGTLQERP